MSRSTGSTGRSSARPWQARPPPPRPARWESSGATRWPCCRSAATTWPTTSGTGWRWARRLSNPPKIFHVNWFKRGDDGTFLWPGYGENLRALDWVIRRCKGEAEAVETPIGYVPAKDALNLNGLDISDEAVDKLLEVDPDAWIEELEGMQKFFDQFGYDLPEEFVEEQQALKTRLGKG